MEAGEGDEQESVATKIKRQQYEQKRRDKIAQGFHSLRDFLEVELALGPIDSNTQALVEAERALRILSTFAVRLSRYPAVLVPHASTPPVPPPCAPCGPLFVLFLRALILSPSRLLVFCVS